MKLRIRIQPGIGCFAQVNHTLGAQDESWRNIEISKHGYKLRDWNDLIAPVFRCSTDNEVKVMARDICIEYEDWYNKCQAEPTYEVVRDE